MYNKCQLLKNAVVVVLTENYQQETLCLYIPQVFSVLFGIDSHKTLTLKYPCKENDYTIKNLGTTSHYNEAHIAIMKCTWS